MLLGLSALSAVVTLAVASTVSSSASLPPNVVDTGYAQYRGNQSFPNTVAYLGIPYAEPPLASLRFRAPLPLNTTRITQQAGGKVVDASQYPNFCIQGSIGEGDAGGAGSEDCLNVNIYAPAGAGPSSNLPVLVYIHGGGYVFGNPANWPFDDWVHQNPDVVVVSVYYRLDSFGFLAHPGFNSPAASQLANAKPSTGLGDFNAGFLDQVQALRWVNQHIKAFGGNPSKVTINGESAGGSSVELHMVANEQQKLFDQVIAQSVYRTPVPTPEQQVPLFNFYANNAGCGTGSVATQMACLRSASVSALARAQDAAGRNASIAYNAFHPVIDGTVLTQTPTAAILNGDFAKVQLMVGACSNETLSGGTNISASLHTFFPELTPADFAAVERAYPIQDFASVQQQHDDATGDHELRCARAIMAGAVSAQPGLKAFAYRYDQPNPTTGSPLVSHASENWMMFRGTNTGTNGSTVFTPQNATELAFASELFAYWLSFVRSGDPSTFRKQGSPEWPQYSASNEVRMVLRESTNLGGSVVETQSQTEAQRCGLVAALTPREQA